MDARRRSILNHLYRMFDEGKSPSSRSSLREAEDLIHDSGVDPVYAYARATGLDPSPEARGARRLEMGYDLPAYHGTHAPNRDSLTDEHQSFERFKPSTYGTPSIRFGSHFAADPRMSNRFSGFDLGDYPLFGFDPEPMEAALNNPRNKHYYPSMYDVFLKGGEQYIRDPFMPGDLGIAGDDRIISSFLRSEYARLPNADPRVFNEVTFDDSYGPSGPPLVDMETAAKLRLDKHDDPRVIDDLDNQMFFLSSEDWTPSPETLKMVRDALARRGVGRLRYRNTNPRETAGGTFDSNSYVSVAPPRSRRAMFIPEFESHENIMYAKGGLIDG